METVILNKGFTSWYQGKLFYQLVRSLIYYWLIMLSYNLLNSFTHTNSYEIFTGVIYALFVAADGLVLWHLSKKNKTFSTDIA